jgi:hypothetical protein
MAARHRLTVLLIYLSQEIDRLTISRQASVTNAKRLLARPATSNAQNPIQVLASRDS